MELRLSAHRAPDEDRSGAPRDLDREGRWHRWGRNGAQAGACRLERKLTRDATRHEQREPLQRSAVEDRRADHLVDRVMPADVFRVVEELLAVGEGRGMDASGFLVALAAREELLEEGARARQVEIRSGHGAAGERAERAEDGGDGAASGGEHAAAIGRFDVVVALGGNLCPEPQFLRAWPQ